VLDDGRELPSAVTIWTAGFSAPELAAGSGLRTDALGRLLTDETLTSIDDPRIVAAGDAAAPSGEPLRMSCQAAIPLGAQAANTVLSRIACTEPAVISMAFVGQCISLGRNGGSSSRRAPTTPRSRCSSPAVRPPRSRKPSARAPSRH
jgi:NADH dehydrogenase